MKREVHIISLAPFHKKMRILNWDTFQSKFLQFIYFLNAIVSFTLSDLFAYCKGTY